MAVRSARLWGPSVVVAGGGFSVIYTVPAGRTFRGWVRIVNTAGVSNRVRLYLTGTATGNRFYQENIASGTTVVIQPLVWNPGDTLYCENLDGNIALTVAGSLLLGVPE